MELSVVFPQLTKETPATIDDLIDYVISSPHPLAVQKAATVRAIEAPLEPGMIREIIVEFGEARYYADVRVIEEASQFEVHVCFANDLPMIVVY